MTCTQCGSPDTPPGRLCKNCIAENQQHREEKLESDWGNFVDPVPNFFWDIFLPHPLVQLSWSIIFFPVFLIAFHFKLDSCIPFSVHLWLSALISLFCGQFISASEMYRRIINGDLLGLNEEPFSSRRVFSFPIQVILKCYHDKTARVTGMVYFIHVLLIMFVYVGFEDYLKQHAEKSNKNEYEITSCETYEK